MTKMKNKKLIGIVAAFFAVLCLTLIYIPNSALADEPDGDYVCIAGVYHTITNTSELVDADLALLEWHAMGNNDTTGDVIVSASFGGEKINRYDNVYAAVYSRLLAAPETTHLVGGDVLLSTSLSESTYHIFAIKGSVLLSTASTSSNVSTSERIIVLAEDSTAKISVRRTGDSSAPPNLTVNYTSAKVAFQGLNKDCTLRISKYNTAYKNNIFSLNSGKLYYNFCDISGFEFRSSNSSTASAASYSFLIIPNGNNAARFLYMSDSTMSGILAQEAPGIFCKAYHSTASKNGQNKLSYLYLYNSVFSDCVSKDGSGDSSYGGAVIRSYAADNCHLRATKCTFKNNKSEATNDASGGGAIYWKSVAGDAVLRNCIFENNSAALVGGAIYNTGKMELYGCEFRGNSAKVGGGAIAVEPPYTTSEYPSLKGVKMSGSLELDSKTVIDGNSTDGNGGAIYFNSYASQIGDPGKTDSFDILEYEMTLEINGADILNNKAKGNGGAIAMWLNYEDREYATGITIKGDSVIRGNIAGYLEGQPGVIGDGDGGAIWMSSAETCLCKLNEGVTMESGVVSLNQARNGGAVYIKTGNVAASMDFTLSGGTIGGEGNTATNGGAVYVDGGNASLLGGSVSNNNATKFGGAVYVNGGDVKIADCLINTTGLDSNKVAENGGAVYMTDGTCTISGSASITNCGAYENGGAVYMGGGTCTISGSASVTNCSADKNGGAIYMGGGRLNVNANGSISENSAENGGGAFVNGGDVYVAGGQITSNKADVNGGGVAINNGNYYMVGGSVDGNTATSGSGGGIYVSADTSNVQVGVYSGSISSNSAKGNGGALSVVGKQDGEKTVQVQIGVNDRHFEDNGDSKSCDHDYKNIVDETVYDCPTVSGNRVSGSGGAVYVTGNNQLTSLDIFCLIEDRENLNSAAGDAQGMSDFMKVDGGKVTITTSSDNTDINNQNDHHGNTTIASKIYVTGGDMELWGTMTNPDINDIITVDITKSGDDFNDYRYNNTDIKYYKLKYFENFKDPETGVITGQYKQYKIAHGDTITINANVYNHPGYEIMGWNTNNKWDEPLVEYYPADVEGKAPSPRPPAGDPTIGWYEIALTYRFDGEPIGDLVIYAIWEANGYIVEYDANVPVGETYFGTMEKSEFVYNGTNNILRPNVYFRPGYIFAGWSEEKNPSDQSSLIADGANVGNLTNEQGKTVTLYAQWVECEHTEIDEYTYEIVENSAQDKVLRRVCSCEAYSEEVRLSASNKVYNMTEHKATVEYSSSWQPVVTYTPLDAGDVLSSNNLPYHAGRYRATVTVTDGEGTPWTISVEYKILKADQPAPEKPLYEAKTEGEETFVYIEPVLPSTITDPTYTSVPQYRVVYYVDGNLQEVTDWAKSTGLIDDKYAVKIQLNKSLINYYIEARYSECDNYNPSPKIVADKVLFFNGGVTFYLVTGEGLIAEDIVADGTDAKVNGITVKVKADNGFYFPVGYTASLETEGAAENAQAVLVPSESENPWYIDGVPYYIYEVTDIPTNCKITMTLPDAKPGVVIESNVAEKQKFEQIDTNSATISADSAYTVLYHIKNYDMSEFKTLTLKFSSVLPAGTTIIMQDRKGTYVDYYYIDASGLNSVKVTEFYRMGHTGNGNKFVERDGELLLQFIVDFSRATENLLASGTFTTTMVCEKEENSLANTVEKGVDVRIEAVPIYILEAVDAEHGEIHFTRTPSLGAASKWDGRAEAIVFTPDNMALIPEDAYLSISCGNQTTEIYSNGRGQFVYYPPSFNDGNIVVILKSILIADVGGKFKFNVEWMASLSEAEKSPLNGTTVASVASVFVSCEVKTSVSLKLVLQNNDNHLFKLGEELRVNAIWQDVPPATHSLKVTMMQKSGGEYINTGISKAIEFTLADSSSEITIPLTGITAGSFKLVIKADQGNSTVAQAEYYFIVE